MSHTATPHPGYAQDRARPRISAGPIRREGPSPERTAGRVKTFNFMLTHIEEHGGQEA